MSATLKDIAKAARVSVCTVSKVLNNPNAITVRDETRARILNIARELNYRPNILARGLVQSRSSLVGVVIPSLTTSYMAETLQALQDVAEEAGFSLLLYTHRFSQKQEAEYLMILRDKGVEGVIWQPIFEKNQLLGAKLAQEMPIIQIHQRFPSFPAPAVTMDNVAGAYLATEHLIRLGHRCIAFLSVSWETDQHGQERLQGYRNAMAAAALPIDPQWIIPADYDCLKGRTATQQLLQLQPNRPTAIVACNDLAAWGAMQAVRFSGLSVPADVAIVGYDDLPLAEMTDVPLTTVAIPKAEIGRLAMQVLLDRLAGEESNGAVLPPHLVIRASCGMQTQTALCVTPLQT